MMVLLINSVCLEYLLTLIDKILLHSFPGTLGDTCVSYKEVSSTGAGGGLFPVPKRLLAAFQMGDTCSSVRNMEIQLSGLILRRVLFTCFLANFVCVQKVPAHIGDVVHTIGKCAPNPRNFAGNSMHNKWFDLMGLMVLMICIP